ncbi:MAG TPA: hypothetical protein VKU60_18155, partial [Chloroflexota bacterium]|nr:hypothetical protein [Chloroflexota bacterium]
DLRVFDADGNVVAHEDLGYDTNGTAWSPDGKYLALGVDDHTFRVWEVSPPQAPAGQAHGTPPSYMGR